MSGGGVERLAQEAANWMTGMVEQWGDEMQELPGDSPIEKLFMLALNTRIYMRTNEFTDLVVLGSSEEPPVINPPNDYKITTRLYIKPQAKLEGRRADYVLYTYDCMPRILKKPGWRSLIIECDGHDFHERTKTQAKRDRSRDRQATANRQDFMRFTGSEIHYQAWDCAGEVLDWAGASFG